MRDLARGVWTLRLIATSAPLLGFLGTCFGIFGAFKGCAGEKSYCMSATVFALAEGITYSALGLAIGIGFRWAHDYCLVQLEDLEQEMKCAAQQLFNQLSRVPSERIISN